MKLDILRLLLLGSMDDLTISIGAVGDLNLIEAES